MTEASKSDLETVHQFCRSLLEGGKLEDKLRPPRGPDGDLLADTEPGPALCIDAPARHEALRMTGGAERLPGLSELSDPAARTVCIERFAHHELQAVELFAWALLAWPRMPAGLRRGFLSTLEEEQQHLRLYLDRLVACGSGLGETRLSDYLWRHVAPLGDSPHGPLAFLAVMGLTFEQANLDFTLLYRDGFARAGDECTAGALAQVHREEIGHVRLAARWFRRLKNPAQDELTAYRSVVPFPLGAARAKGRRFDAAARRRAGLSEAMIEHVRAARPYDAGDAAPQGVLLLANLGEEEGKRRGRTVAPAIRRTARLWALLFGSGTCLVYPPGEGDAHATSLEAVPWPASLGPQPGRPAFDWLPEDGGLSWLPSSAAAAILASRGVTTREPDAAVVRRVHDKAFALAVVREKGLLPVDLEPLLQTYSPEELLAADFSRRLADAVGRWPDWTHGHFALKPRLGTTGRGRLHGRWSLATGEGDGPAGALRRLAAQGGAILEPWLSRRQDLSVQLHVGGQRDVEILGTTRQLLRPSGVAIGNRGCFGPTGQPASGTVHDEAITQAAVEVARAAAAAGFRGPCGTDAFVYAGPGGAERLRPVVELNARFTTGTIALGLLRRAREAERIGSRTHWAFLLRGPRDGWPAAQQSTGIVLLGDGGAGRSPGALLFAGSQASLDGLLEAGAGIGGDDSSLP